jgi:hypothetical protein
MQAYQSPPCPYCGVTWNQPGAQSCANCRNPLPPAQAGYAPPGYQNYPPQNYPQPPAQYPGPPPGYQGQQGQPTYPSYGPPGYPPAGYGPDQGYTTYAPGDAPAQGTTIRLFGQSFTVPFALPPVALPAAVGRYAPGVVKGALGLVAGLVVALLLIVAVIPAVASGQLSSAKQSLVTAASHQAKVDDAFTQLFNAKTYSGDPNTFKAQFDKQAKAFNDGLTLVQSDEAAVQGVEQRLAIIQWVAPSKRAAITAQRNRLNNALVGLKQADQALTAAVNEAKVIQPYTDALIDYTKIAAAFAKKDLVAAGAPYPDAHQKIQQAMSNAHAAGLPPQMAKQVSSFNDVLTSTESLLQAIQAKDSAGIKTSTDAINAALKAMSSPDETVPADYESKMFGPMQKAYDAAIKTIKSGS